MNNFQRTYSTGEVEIEPYNANSCIYHKTEYRERRNHYALCAVNSSCDGFDTDRDSFLGTYGSPQMQSMQKHHIIQKQADGTLLHLSEKT